MKYTKILKSQEFQMKMFLVNNNCRTSSLYTCSTIITCSTCNHRVIKNIRRWRTHISIRTGSTTTNGRKKRRCIWEFSWRTGILSETSCFGKASVTWLANKTSCQWACCIVWTYHTGRASYTVCCCAFSCVRLVCSFRTGCWECMQRSKCFWTVISLPTSVTKRSSWW